MNVSQIAVREIICRRILDLSDEEIEQVVNYLDELEGHEPNEATAAALADSEAGRNMSGIYDDVEEMLSDLLKADHA